jgi:osmotically-inducible protein OsmY
MEYARVETSLTPRGWSRQACVRGAVAGPAHAIAIELTTLRAVYTVITHKRARQLGVPPGSLAAQEPGASASQVLVTVATRVAGPHGLLGRVAQVWVSRGTGSVTHVLVETREARSASVYILPAEAIVELAPKRLQVKLSPRDLRGLPLYRPDQSILAEVNASIAAVLADPRARRSVKVRVDDGHVLLSGEVDTTDQVNFVIQGVSGIRGVRGVDIDLVAQEELAANVESRIRALAAYGDVTVLTEHGIVYLEGTVPSGEARSEVERIALSAVGARVVVNNLRVAGEPPDRGSGTGPLVRNR